MFERFSQEARAVVVAAQEETRRLHHASIGSAELLIGVATRTQHPAAKLLAEMGADVDRIRAEVEAQVARQLAEPEGHIPFDQWAKRALEQSLAEAKRLGHADVDVSHVLLGLTADATAMSRQLLLKLGVDVEVLRGRIAGLVFAPADVGDDTPSSGAVVDEESTFRARRQRAKWETLRREVGSLIDDLERLTEENERLRHLLRESGIDADGGRDEAADG